MSDAKDYIKKLDQTQLANIAVIKDRMIKKGITNPYSQAAILSIASKESGFKPKYETGYGKTANTQIRKIFGAKLKDVTDAQLTELKKDDKKFFNKVYGGRYGNTDTTGYIYRGGGFNQLTFHDNYAAIGKEIGVDLVSHPEKINEIGVATDALLAYFQHKFDAAKKDGSLAKFNSTGINDFKNSTDSINAFYAANAGFHKELPVIGVNDHTGGYTLAVSRVNGFLDMVGKTVSENKGKIGGGAIIITLGLAAYLFKDQLKQLLT